MNFAFDRDKGLIVVRAEVFGPLASGVLRLALDTGATRTLIDSSALAALGYDASQAADRVHVTTGSGVELSALIEIGKLIVLGQERRSFSVLSHKLPATLSVDGVLGLDFLRNRDLRIDFRTGQITLG
jgi:predicted aspartyl protease